MRDKLISRDDIRTVHPIFRGKNGDKNINRIVKISGLHIVNDIYDKSKHLTGVDFCSDLLDKLDIKRTVINREILEGLNNQPFVTVSNHPYGHLDGIALIEAVGSHSESFKLMVNHILGLIDTMEDNFIVVNPHNKNASTTLNGVRSCARHVLSGNSLGLFPAGAVSYLNFRSGKPMIIDRDWQLSVIKLIRKVNVPVIPIHISGRNTIPFYLLRLFGYRARDLRLCHELKNKGGKEIVITVGEPILPEIITDFEDDVKLGEYLKEQTYSLSDENIRIKTE